MIHTSYRILSQRVKSSGDVFSHHHPSEQPILTHQQCTHTLDELDGLPSELTSDRRIPRTHRSNKILPKIATRTPYPMHVMGMENSHCRMQKFGGLSCLLPGMGVSGAKIDYNNY
ncbi:unnamed protein product [Nippostrongylus brasiliensis]|uniref:Ovule protein n=1 Tax=Nippostrongylus brasiliensis TaxID=27835 RepID=A0A0N4YV44_NIPBR|nr:unnamed protein product [Nippostrongylus brasiliensis]